MIDYPGTDDLPSDGVPIRQAATLLLLADRPDLHTVFPGGALDPEDSDARWPGLVRGLQPGDADDALGIGPGSLAFWIAAVRETIEEVGVAVGLGRDLVDHRDDLDNGRVRLCDLVGPAGLDLSGVHPVARWVTPIGGPKRYDTFFFVAAAPPDADPMADGAEAVDVDWMRPAEALDRWRSGGLTMIGPTISMLERLAGFGSSAEALAAAAESNGTHRRRTRVTDLKRYPGYEVTDAREAMGWAWFPPGEGGSGTTAP